MANNNTGHPGYYWYDTLTVANYTDYIYTGTWAANADGSAPSANNNNMGIFNKFKMADGDLKVQFLGKTDATGEIFFYLCKNPSSTLSECLATELDYLNDVVQTNILNNGWDSNAMAFGAAQYSFKILFNSSTNYYKVYVNNVLKATSDTLAYNLSDFKYYKFVNVDIATPIENFTVSDGSLLPNSDNAYLNVSIYKERTPGALLTSTLNLSLIGENTSQSSTTSTGMKTLYNMVPGFYELRFGNDALWPVRTYFLNLTQNENLLNVYLLDSNYTLTTIQVKDQNSAVLPNAYITLQRNYVISGQSVFYGLAILKTNNEGKVQVYLEHYDAYYKFQFANQYGTDVYLLTDPIAIVSATPTFFVNTEADVYESFSRYDDIVYNLSFVNTTLTPYAKLVFADSTNILREACLKVDYVSATEYENICYTCISAASGTLTCKVNNTWQGQFKAVAEFDTNTEHSWITAATAWWGKDPTFSFELPGLYIALIVVGTVALMGIGSVSGSILLMFVGIAAMASLTLIMGLNMQWLMYIGIFGMIVIFLIRRGTQ